MQEPNLNNELRDEILAGGYKAPARPGMINPDEQLNWHLGVPAEITESIEVMIINDAGDAERMGLISALFALSQGDKVEDAVQELAIVLGYKEADKALNIKIENHHRVSDVQSFEAWVGESLPTKSEIADYFGEHPSAFECDGERTEFKPAKDFKGNFTIYVNGVETGFIDNGFSVTLDRAPETGSDVKFIGMSSSISDRIKAVKEVIESTLSVVDDASAEYEQTIIDLKSENEGLNEKRAELETEITAFKDAEKAATASYEDAKQSAYEGTSVDEVEEGGKDAQEKLMTLEEANLEVDAAEHSLTVLDDTIKAVLKAIDSTNANKEAFDADAKERIAKYEAELAALEADRTKYEEFGNKEA